MAARRVVVTGLGCVTPLGIGVEASWKNCLAGRSGVGPITKFDAAGLKTQIAAEVKGFDPSEYMDRREVKKMDTFIQYAVAAARMAVADAGLEIGEAEAERVGVSIGAGLGGLPGIEAQHKVLLESGPRRVSPFFIPMVIANLAPGYVAIQTGAKGPNLSIVTACATGSHSIGEAWHAIRRGDADVMLAGGVESTITPLAVAGFNAMRALSTRNDEPERASRPFDKDRDGFVMGEGGAVLILEELERARARGAEIYAELVGYGATCDAYHITAPDPQGDGAARCMEAALRSASLAPDELDYINAHGTSTPFNDYYETLAIKRVFGDHAKRLWVSSTKSMTGHLLGAAGSVEAAFSVLALRDQVAPPTINYDTPDPDCDLDYVPNEARQGRIRTALSNSFGFGGTNASLLFRRFEG
ncbi:beta-ketoacyl-ACP synthase II [Deferrisoma camini]|uniref:beta-ketoacyl-ACP synthase II n=1 Tax=Deferrisoma camini TaxID=1035120 RepID=UPI00046D86EC|nr:beta-ketoacyl-ACP synthase II [Deferrisoma camini]